MARSSAERVRDHRERQRGLEAARARGRAYGEDEARRRNEGPEKAAERVERAVAYAVWEFNGKPITGVPLSVKELV